MNQDQSQQVDRVTVLVFKDHLAARVFHIPVRWIPQLGIMAGSLILFSIVTSVLALRYYHLASSTEPLVSPVGPPLVTSISSNLGRSSPTAGALTDQNESQTPQPNLPNESDLKSGAQANPLFGTLFTALSADDPTAPIPSAADLPIAIKNPRFSWQNDSLQFRFALQYTKTDRGSQQGKIIVLARGPSMLLTYPAGAFNSAGQTPLIDFQKGEFFSVSRYREGSATFGPLLSKDSLQELEVLILSKSGSLLLHQSFPLKPEQAAQEDS